MCEFKVMVKEPGKDEKFVIEEISYLFANLADGKVLLRGLGVQDSVENAMIAEINVYSENGAVARLFKAPIVGSFMKFLTGLENGKYSEEIEENWNSLVKKGHELLAEMKK